MVNNSKKTLSGWGLNKKELCKVKPYSETLKLKDFRKVKLIARGLGRSYGDSSFQKKLTIDMTSHNKIISFNREKGHIVVESGISIEKLLEDIVSKGWMLPVTPGSKYVTVGGMVASNVHGKNHHKDGGFSNFISEMQVLNKYKKIATCSKKKNKELFNSTIGGMGLTGIILNVTIKLLKIESSLIYQKKVFTKDLEETMNFFEKKTNKYSVAWLNFNFKNKKLGCSIIFLGEHATKMNLKKNKISKKMNFQGKTKITIPFLLPFSIFNFITITIFNYLYFNFQRMKLNSFVDIDNYFYPLDRINYWNRLYGVNGFIQYQFVLPKKTSYEGLKEICNYLITKKLIPFLPVLKYFSKDDIGILSFPLNGFTLAMDFPNTKKTRNVLNHLDKIVIHHGGRVYLTKDSRLNKKNFRIMYAEKLKKFKNNRYFSPLDFSSSQSERLF